MGVPCPEGIITGIVQILLESFRKLSTIRLDCHIIRMKCGWTKRDVGDQSDLSL